MAPNNSSSEEKYRLKWESSTKPVDLQDVFQTLRDNDELFDVTIGCSTNDGGIAQVRAHKLVLSAYSPVMKDLMTHLQGKNEPFVYLKGISQDNLSCILDFMYNGCVDIPKTNLNQFLEDAQELQIKGLKVSNESDPNESIAKSLTNNIKTQSRLQKNVIKRELENLMSSKLQNLNTKGGHQALDKSDNDPDFKINIPKKVRRPVKKFKSEEEISNEEPLTDDHDADAPEQLKLKKIDDLKEDQSQNLDNSNVMDDSTVEMIYTHFENLKDKTLMSGNRARTYSRCKVCLKEIRRDRRKMHWDNNHKNAESVTCKNALNMIE